jgi:hypothetical protein
VSYHLPYSGKIKIEPKPLYPTDHVVLMLPKSMQFTGGGAGYQTMTGGDPNANIQVITNVNPGQDLSFNLSGTGTIPEDQQEPAGAAGGQRGAGQAGEMAQRGRPGGGLGAPEETPDPLHRYRGFILGGLAVALALGVFYVVTRPQSATTGGQTAPQSAVPPSKAEIRLPAAAQHQQSAPQTQPSNLLAALKEELFQLEMERHQGKISAEEYESAKAALDATLARAAKRAVAHQ